MAKALSSYKDKIVLIAIQTRGDKLIGRYTTDKLALRLRSMVEFTGAPDRDIESLVMAILALIRELPESYL